MDKKTKSMIGIILIILLFCSNTPLSAVMMKNPFESIIFDSIAEEKHQPTDTPQTYIIDTPDDETITFTRFPGNKAPIIFVHGMGCNHRIFDLDKDHSLARYLNGYGWDVWLLDLRTHDGDGDYKYSLGSDREYINRYWDFDNTLLKIDVATGVNFVKQETDRQKIYLSGHSYGGYLAYAYAMILGEENLSGIITTGASPYANTESFSERGREKRNNYGYIEGNKAFVRPDGKPYTHTPDYRLTHLISVLFWPLLDHSESTIFYEQTTPYSVQRKCLLLQDAEPAGVLVDMAYGRDPALYNGSMVDPQTLYDYSANLEKITVPILFISGEKDPQDPAEYIYQAYENVSSSEKQYYCFKDHSHMDLLFAEDCNTHIFPKIHDWLQKQENKE